MEKDFLGGGATHIPLKNETAFLTNIGGGIRISLKSRIDFFC